MAVAIFFAIFGVSLLLLNGYLEKNGRYGCVLPLIGLLSIIFSFCAAIKLL